MSRFWSAAILIGILSATPVSAWDRGDVDVLAVLPDVTPGVPSSVEGLTVGPDDNIYVTKFWFQRDGRDRRQRCSVCDQAEWQFGTKSPDREFQSTSSWARLQSSQRILLVLDFGAGKVLNVDPVTGASSESLSRTR